MICAMTRTTLYTFLVALVAALLAWMGNLAVAHASTESKGTAAPPALTHSSIAAQTRPADALADIGVMTDTDTMTEAAVLAMQAGLQAIGGPTELVTVTEGTIYTSWVISDTMWVYAAMHDFSTPEDAREEVERRRENTDYHFIPFHGLLYGIYEEEISDPDNPSRIMRFIAHIWHVRHWYFVVTCNYDVGQKSAPDPLTFSRAFYFAALAQDLLEPPPVYLPVVVR